jgi:hypothetical protein
MCIITFLKYFSHQSKLNRWAELLKNGLYSYLIGFLIIICFFFVSNILALDKPSDLSIEVFLLTSRFWISTLRITFRLKTRIIKPKHFYWWKKTRVYCLCSFCSHAFLSIDYVGINLRCCDTYIDYIHDFYFGDRSTSQISSLHVFLVSAPVGVKVCVP